ncbi:hypothetical protein HD554DRAFT_2169874 [Boletus coccyginus]|nr:hypothetical protein HD554DRAFT_2169872 [Boletus coccyginus]KAI9570727.1 hypothetical protein HD554DRAFT_2169874 [Boletus coccyginus]
MGAKAMAEITAVVTKGECQMTDTSRLSTGGAVTMQQAHFVPNPNGGQPPVGGPKPCPKAGDYDGPTHHILDTAIQFYHALLLMEIPFPQPHVEIEWAKTAWDLSCQFYYGTATTHNPDILKLATRAFNLDGQFKMKAHLIIVTTFGFESGASSTAQQSNRNLVTALKSNLAFVFHEFRPPLVSIYRNKGVQQVINKVLFQNKTDEGIKWPEYYQPFPIAGYALALIAVECAIDEWASRSCEQIAFTKEAYLSIYNAHIDNLEFFDKKIQMLNILPMIMKEIYNNGKLHASIPII